MTCRANEIPNRPRPGRDERNQVQNRPERFSTWAREALVPFSEASR